MLLLHPVIVTFSKSVHYLQLQSLQVKGPVQTDISTAWRKIQEATLEVAIINYLMLIQIILFSSVQRFVVTVNFSTNLIDHKQVQFFKWRRNITYVTVELNGYFNGAPVSCDWTGKICSYVVLNIWTWIWKCMVVQQKSRTWLNFSMWSHPATHWTG